MGNDGLTASIEAEKQRIIGLCAAERGRLASVFSRSVGLRGVFSGLEQFRQAYFDIKIEVWGKIADRYIKHLNAGLDASWFEDSKLRHIAFDHSGVVVNYRLDQVVNAMGAYCALVAVAQEPKLLEDGEQIGSLISTLEGTLKKGFRREVKPKILEDHPEASVAVLKVMVDEAAERKTVSAIRSLKKRLGLLLVND